MYSRIMRYLQDPAKFAEADRVLRNFRENPAASPWGNTLPSVQEMARVNAPAAAAAAPAAPGAAPGNVLSNLLGFLNQGFDSIVGLCFRRRRGGYRTQRNKYLKNKSNSILLIYSDMIILRFKYNLYVI
jgi:hypothetical protein